MQMTNVATYTLIPCILAARQWIKPSCPFDRQSTRISLQPPYALRLRAFSGSSKCPSQPPRVPLRWQPKHVRATRQRCARHRRGLEHMTEVHGESREDGV